MKTSKKIIKAQGYQVYIGNKVIKSLATLLNKPAFRDCKTFVIVDENTREHCLPIVLNTVDKLKNAEIIEIKSGEENKTLETAKNLWTELIVKGAYRCSVIINLGGGVICDIGGFVASTFKRGIPFINIPTTLLSQVDASIGGKTAIDFYEVKNQIGLFSNPQAVFINPEFLSTLPERQILSGYGEIIKHALIRDAKYWEILKTLKLKDITDWTNIISHSVSIKNEIVTSDPYDLKLRKKLNFGHTVGHAIEGFSMKKDEDPLLHGEAVAIGMICEGYLSFLKTGLSSDQLDELTDYILSIFPYYRVDEKDKEQLLNIMSYDKKNMPQTLNFSLIKNIGSALINKTCTAEEISESIDFYNDAVETVRS